MVLDDVAARPGGPAVPRTPLPTASGAVWCRGDRHGETQGIDLSSGAQLWSIGRTSCPCLGPGPVLLLSATPAVPTGLSAIEVRTGVALWQLAFEPATHLVDLLDDRVLLADAEQLTFYEW